MAMEPKDETAVTINRDQHRMQNRMAQMQITMAR
jgi:hypothetical protein